MKRRNRKIFFEQPIQISGINYNHDMKAEGDGGGENPTILKTPIMIIPFMSGQNSGQRAFNSQGLATSGVIEGFGQSSASDTNPAISSTGTITLTTDTCYSFIMPCTAVLDKICLNATYATAWDSRVHPFVAVATADPESITFTIQYDSQTYVENLTSNAIAYSVFSGRTEDINLTIEAGTKVAILTAATSDSYNYHYSMAMNGSLLFKPLPEE